MGLSKFSRCATLIPNKYSVCFKFEVHCYIQHMHIYSCSDGDDQIMCNTHSNTQKQMNMAPKVYFVSRQHAYNFTDCSDDIY